MITLQSRGVDFIEGKDGLSGWRPISGSDDGIFAEMEESLGIKSDYLHTLTDEGPAFRKRFVAFVEAAG